MKLCVGPGIASRPAGARTVGRRSIRFQITLLATALVACGLVVSAAALVVLQRSALTAGLDQSLAQRADDLTAQLGSGGFPDTLPGSGLENFAQVVGPDGVVLLATPNLVGKPALDIPVGTTGSSVRTLADLPVDDDVFRVLVRPKPDGGVLYVGSTYDVVTESVSALVASMALVIPVLVVGFSALIWWLVGRTLSPVEDIRSEVSEIGMTDLHRRVAPTGTQDEIDRLVATMNEMLERIEASVDRQQRFVADASHELRSPLTRLRSQIEVEMVGVPDSPALDELLEEVTAMQNLVEDLLSLARADADRGITQTRSVDLDDIVFREARRVIERGRVDVDLTGVSAAHVDGDPGQLARLVRNLLDNSERHATGRVSLSLEEAEGYAILKVTDDGPGIAPADETKVFQRFARLDEARSADTGGAGLGLSIAREVALSHGGELKLVPWQGAGATFELRIPLVD